MVTPDEAARLVGREREAYVAALFDRIARPYDRLNRLISMGRDEAWRRTVLEWAEVARGEDAVDLGTGTGDLFCALKRRVGPEGRVIGLDIAANMLEIAREKARRSFEGDEAELVLGNAQDTGLPAASADVVTMSWVLRNVGDRQAAYREVRRLLRPGGRFLCLEMSHPTNPVVRLGCAAYMRLAMPVLVRVFGGDREAYDYLTSSTEKFPGRHELSREMSAAGFEDVRSRTFMFGGIAAHLARTPAEETR